MPSGRGSRRRPTGSLAALLVLALTLLSATGRARAELRLQPADPTAPPTYVPPGANLGAEPQPEQREPLTRKWWFWGAVGAVVVTTVVVILVANRDPSPPRSTLGNMDAFQGR